MLGVARVDGLGADLGLGVLGVAWVDGLSADLGLGVLGMAWVDGLGANLGMGLLGVGLGVTHLSSLDGIFRGRGVSE